jgi:hypothetical protein
MMSHILPPQIHEVNSNHAQAQAHVGLLKTDMHVPQFRLFVQLDASTSPCKPTIRVSWVLTGCPFSPSTSLTPPMAESACEAGRVHKFPYLSSRCHTKRTYYTDGIYLFILFTLVPARPTQATHRHCNTTLCRWLSVDAIRRHKSVIV